VRRIVLGALLIAACGGGEPTSFGVNVTMDAHAIAAGDLARITTANLTVSGVEQYAKSFDISAPVKTGDVRFRYVPAVHAGLVTLTVDVTDAAGGTVATGVSDPVELVANKAVSASIVLGRPVLAMDMAVANDAGDDAGTVNMDLSQPAAADLSEIATNCMGMGKCVYTCVQGGTDVNTCSTRCSQTAKPGSATKWNSAVLCGQDYCVGNADMMSGRCILVAMPGSPGSSLLCDPGSTYAQCTSASYTSTSCLPCLDQARNIWLYDDSVDPSHPGPPTGMCSMPTSADCMGATAECMTQFNACLNDP
jgi:hypothetical protein